MDKTIRVNRQTRETHINLSLKSEASYFAGAFTGESGLGFIDHMLEVLARYGGFDLQLSMTADAHIDDHHGLEDLGLVLGTALKTYKDQVVYTPARFGNALIPMDESLSQAVIDFSDRPYCALDLEGLKQPKIKDFEVCLLSEFFRALTQTSGMTLHLKVLESQNAHHGVESLFKALGMALRQALSPLNLDQSLSTKGKVDWRVEILD